MKGTVYGIGVNDSKLPVTSKAGGDEETCKAYSSWCSMLTRAYSKKYQEKQPTYSNVSVCTEWLVFSRFKHWWVDNYVYGWQLDKDLLSDGRVYSPSTCIYIPRWLNVFTNHGGADGSKGLIGSYAVPERGMFRSQCGNPQTGKHEHLGYFYSRSDAHAAWKKRKLEIALDMKQEMDSIDKRIYERVVEIISRRGCEPCTTSSST